MHSIESLESRIAPATLFVVDDANNLLRFDSGTPGTIDATIALTGLAGGGTEKIRGLDARTLTSELYALGVVDAGATDDLRIYRIDPATGVATQVGTVPISATSGDGIYGFDFNPTVDRIRVVNGAGENLRINPFNGGRADTPTNDTDLTPAANDITAAAYDRNFLGSVGVAAGTTLYGIDITSDQLVTIGGINQTPSPNGGAITNVGALGVNVSNIGGFDIQGINTAFAALNVGGNTGLYAINLATGGASFIGAIGSGAIAVNGLTAGGTVVSLPTSKSATYLDADGDLVTVKVSKGTLDRSDIGVALPAPGALGGQLALLALSDDGDEFAGANITITVKKAATGDGFANVGTIDSLGHDLGVVTIKGTLINIVAGDLATDVGLVKLSVQGLGGSAFTAAGALALSSTITGKLNVLQVRGDVIDVSISAESLGTVTVGGSIIGNTRGTISGSKGIGSIFVKGSIIGSASGGANAGRIDSLTGDIGKLTIGGSIIGGSFTGTGFVFCGGFLKSGTVLGSIIGGDFPAGGSSQSGAIRANAGIVSLTIGGSLIGGSGDATGEIVSFADIKNVKIGGNIIGGGISGTQPDASGSGFIEAGGSIGTVTVGGSIITGADNSSAGVLRRNASIGANDGIGKIIVKGSIIGNATTPALIVATNDHPVTGLAIGSVTVGGNVQRAQILAGFGFFSVLPSTPDVHIGTVTVGRDWIASSISAGIQDSGADGFGLNDAVIAGGDPAITSRIAKIQIKGLADGVPNNPASFGFVAQEIGSLVVGARKLLFTAGPGNDTTAQLLGTTATLRAVELP